MCLSNVYKRLTSSLRSCIVLGHRYGSAARLSPGVSFNCRIDSCSSIHIESILTALAGLVATLQALQYGECSLCYVAALIQVPVLTPRSGYPAYLSTRFLLGSFESGFIPASLFTISRFYKRDETSKRFAWFFIGNHLATAVSGVVAYVSICVRFIVVKTDMLCDRASSIYEACSN